MLISEKHASISSKSVLKKTWLEIKVIAGNSTPKNANVKWYLIKNELDLRRQSRPDHFNSVTVESCRLGVEALNRRDLVELF